MCIWTAGVRASEVATSLGFKTNSEGKITVSPRLSVRIYQVFAFFPFQSLFPLTASRPLQVTGEEGVHALGDIADCRDVLMDQAAATAQVRRSFQINKGATSVPLVHGSNQCPPRARCGFFADFLDFSRLTPTKFRSPSLKQTALRGTFTQR